MKQFLASWLVVSLLIPSAPYAETHPQMSTVASFQKNALSAPPFFESWNAIQTLTRAFVRDVKKGLFPFDDWMFGPQLVTSSGWQLEGGLSELEEGPGFFSELGNIFIKIKGRWLDKKRFLGDDDIIYTKHWFTGKLQPNQQLTQKYHSVVSRRRLELKHPVKDVPNQHSPAIYERRYLEDGTYLDEFGRRFKISRLTGKAKQIDGPKRLAETEDTLPWNGVKWLKGRVGEAYLANDGETYVKRSGQWYALSDLQRKKIPVRSKLSDSPIAKRLTPTEYVDQRGRIIRDGKVVRIYDNARKGVFTGSDDPALYIDRMGRAWLQEEDGTWSRNRRYDDVVRDQMTRANARNNDDYQKDQERRTREEKIVEALQGLRKKVDGIILNHDGIWVFNERLGSYELLANASEVKEIKRKYGSPKSRWRFWSFPLGGFFLMPLLMAQQTMAAVSVSPVQDVSFTPFPVAIVAPLLAVLAFQNRAFIQHSLRLVTSAA